jgi:hypothetical protein
MKIAVVCNISINFVFFANNFENSPKKDQKNGQKNESCSRKLAYHGTKNIISDLFSELHTKPKKNTNFTRHMVTFLLAREYFHHIALWKEPSKFGICMRRTSNCTDFEFVCKLQASLGVKISEYRIS